MRSRFIPRGEFLLSKIVQHVLFFGGIGAVLYGVQLLSHSAAFICGGVLLVFYSLILDRASNP